MAKDNLYSGANDPNAGELIYAETIRAMMRAHRSDKQDDAPLVIDDYIFIPVNCSEELKVRHKLLRLASYDEDSGIWTVVEPFTTDADEHGLRPLGQLYAVYHEHGYAILIGEKPVRVNLENDDDDIDIANNLGGNEDQFLSVLSHGLLAITEPIEDTLAAEETYYCLVVRGSFDSRIVHCYFDDYENEDDEADLIARCNVASATVTGLLGQVIKVKDVDGEGFGTETEAALNGRLCGAVWVNYNENNWRWELFTISCAPS